MLKRAQDQHNYNRNAQDDIGSACNFHITVVEEIPQVINKNKPENSSQQT